MNNLTKIRKQKNLTQAQVAKALNIGQSTLSQYERGSRNMDEPIILMFANYYNVSADYLLGIDETKQKAIDETMAMYDGLSPEDKDKVKAFVQFMISQNQ